VGFVDFIISLAILGVLLVWYRYCPDARMLAAPLFILMALTASLGAGLWIAALTVKYRDFRFIAPFIVQIGFFVSPVWYTSDKFQGVERMVYSLNPIVGAIDGLRWAVFRGAVPLYWPGLVISIYTSLVLLITAIIYFRKTEKLFADMI
jgi:lipopolysaccharide transport system permease protein